MRADAYRNNVRRRRASLRYAPIPAPSAGPRPAEEGGSYQEEEVTPLLGSSQSRPTYVPFWMTMPFGLLVTAPSAPQVMPSPVRPS